MPKLRDLRHVDADYATTGPNLTTLRQPIAKPAAAVFRSLEDGPAWKEWLGIDVEWTSPEPFGVGTTRTVTTGRQVIEETFLTWEPGRRMAFRFDRCTLPVEAFAEDYLVEDDGDEACELVWSYAFEWGGPLPALAAPMFNAVFSRAGTRALKKLATMMESTDRFDHAAS